MLPKPVVLASALLSLLPLSVDALASIGGTAPTERRCLPGALLGCARGLGGNLGLGLGGVGLGLGLRCLFLTVRPLRIVPSGEGSNLRGGGGGRMLNLLGFFFSPVLAVAPVASEFSVSPDLARWNLASSL